MLNRNRNSLALIAVMLGGLVSPTLSFAAVDPLSSNSVCFGAAFTSCGDTVSVGVDGRQGLPTAAAAKSESGTDKRILRAAPAKRGKNRRTSRLHP